MAFWTEDNAVHGWDDFAGSTPPDSEDDEVRVILV